MWLALLVSHREDGRTRTLMPALCWYSVRPARWLCATGLPSETSLNHLSLCILVTLHSQSNVKTDHTKNQRFDPSPKTTDSRRAFSRFSLMWRDQLSVLVNVISVLCSVFLFTFRAQSRRAHLHGKQIWMLTGSPYLHFDYCLFRSHVEKRAWYQELKVHVCL